MYSAEILNFKPSNENKIIFKIFLTVTYFIYHINVVICEVHVIEIQQGITTYFCHCQDNYLEKQIIYWAR